MSSVSLGSSFENKSLSSNENPIINVLDINDEDESLSSRGEQAEINQKVVNKKGGLNTYLKRANRL